MSQREPTHAEDLEATRRRVDALATAPLRHDLTRPTTTVITGRPKDGVYPGTVREQILAGLADRSRSGREIRITGTEGQSAEDLKREVDAVRDELREMRP